MRALKLPIIRTKMGRERHLSMDDYLRFVITNLKFTVDMTTVRRLKKKLSVSIPFIMK